MRDKNIYQRIVDDLHGEGFDFRINDLDESVEVSISGQWQRLTDTLEQVIKMRLLILGYSKKPNPSLTAAQTAWVTLAHKQRYNPIKEYFLSLDGKYEPGSDGQPYVTEMFAKFFDNPDGYFGRWLFRWMVGAIAKVFDRERNPMLVLVGPQKKGKSFLARWLCPVDRVKCFTEKPITTDSKDHKILLAQKLIWEVPELGATTRKQDIEAVKAFLTTRDIDERPPYGKYPVYKPVCCSFIGSVNDDGAGFLNDPTGSTRFLACEILSINHSYTIHDINQLWAEAYWFYRNYPNAHQLTPEEDQARERINASFEMVSALEEVLLTLFEFTGEEDDTLTTDLIKFTLEGHYRIGNQNGFLRELNRLMKKHGAVKWRTTYQPGKPHKRGFSGVKVRPQVEE